MEPGLSQLQRRMVGSLTVEELDESEESEEGETEQSGVHGMPNCR